MKIIRTILIIFLLLAVLAVGSFAGLGIYLNGSTDELSEDVVVFQVKKGATFNEIAYDLERAELIRSSLFLRIYNKLVGSSMLVKTGSYNISVKDSSLQIARQLVEGKQKLLAVAIPEGLTIRKVAEIFSEAGIVEKREFIDAALDGSYLQNYGIEAQTLEGFLFPDTYSFQKDYPADKVVHHMVDVFFEKLKAVYPDYHMLTENQIHEKIVLSSIIEKEYRVAEEASRMASVFYNRLDLGMRLQSCATVVYVLTEEQGREHPERLLFSDLEIESPFNTYVGTGLPPAPISNPGTVALDAVFNPAQTEYLFFVVDDPVKGTHRFTKNYDDHLEAADSYFNTFRSK